MLKSWWGRLEKRRVATESSGDETRDETGGPRTRPVKRQRRRLVTNETAATGGVMYTDKGELEFDEDEMAALEGQRLVVELFPDSGSEPDFEGFHASEPAKNLSGGNNSGSEEGRLSDAVAAAAYRTNHNLPD